MKIDKLQLLFFNCSLFLFSISNYAQTSQGSNIVSRTILQANGERSIEQRVYDNGLGDIVQKVQSFPGTSFPDVIVHQEYDKYRRMTKTWLPVTSSSNNGYIGRDRISYIAETQYRDAAPFSLTVYDNLLLSQPSAQYQAGTEWQNNNKKSSLSYDECEGVGMFGYEDSLIYTMPHVQYFRTQSFDEDSCLKAEYTDVKGRLKVSETHRGKTYYVYNNKGDISFVIPPALSEYIISCYGCDSDDIPDINEMIQKYAYIYHYDYRRNCIYKKLPGCEPIYYVYDKAGNCVFSQDGNQRQRGEWSFSIPDKFGRPCISGICHNSITYSRDPLQQNPIPAHIYAVYNGESSSLGGYTVSNFSLASPTLYSASYYDDYSFIGHHGIPTSLASSSVTGFSFDSSLGKGLQTGTATAYFNENGVAGYTYSAMYYDSRYNVSQVVATNHLGRRDITSTNYSYTGKPTKMVINHNLYGRGDKETYTYTYDGADRLSRVTHKLDGGSGKTLQQNSYNGLGQLTSTSNSIFTTTYTYDMHSWLKSISVSNPNTLFRENLKYNDSDHPCYNGNISAMTWMNRGSSTQRYDFIYDNASRLTSASYTVGNESGRYDTQYSYDRMGNITSLKRNGLLDDGSYGLIDDLTLTYDGNQLMAVSDNGEELTYNNAWHFVDGANDLIEYEYDENGNLTKDSNRNILSIQYNSLNLPTVIAFADGKTIKYTYSADGRKLRAVYTTTTPATTKQIDYCGNLIFENGQLKQVLVDGGYIPVDDWSGAYCYYVKDHLGNNRMVVHQSGSVNQVNNYYPYGGLMANSTGWNTQRYKYNGKELDRMHGLDWYDYGARWMDASIGRWHSVDPLCEKFYNVSPYVYCGNSPINSVDPDGRIPLPLITGGLGAIGGACIEGYTAYVSGKSSDEIFGAAARGAIEGAVLGATMGAGASVLVGTIASASGGAAGSAAEQYISKGEVKSKDIIVGGAAGAIGGVAGSAGSKLVKNVANKAAVTAERKITSTTMQKSIKEEAINKAGLKTHGHSARTQVNSNAKNITKNKINVEKTDIKVKKVVTDYIQQNVMGKLAGVVTNWLSNH